MLREAGGQVSQRMQDGRMIEREKKMEKNLLAPLRWQDPFGPGPRIAATPGCQILLRCHQSSRTPPCCWSDLPLGSASTQSSHDAAPCSCCERAQSSGRAHGSQERGVGRERREMEAVHLGKEKKRKEKVINFELTFEFQFNYFQIN